VKVLRVSRAKAKQKLRELKERGARLIAMSNVGNVLVYHLDVGGKLINLRVRLYSERPVAATVTDVWPNAELYEREIMEKTAIHIEGHPRPRRLFTE
jgi:NADH:ubiquinone oxidoreductase subunit C